MRCTPACCGTSRAESSTMFDRCSVVEVRCVVECTVVYDEEDVLSLPPREFLLLIKSLICSTRGVVLGVAESNSTRGKWSGQIRCPICHPAKPDLPAETPLTPAMSACLCPIWPSVSVTPGHTSDVRHGQSSAATVSRKRLDGSINASMHTLIRTTMTAMHSNRSSSRHFQDGRTNSLMSSCHKISRLRRE
jgi:hypothetical protein